MSEERPQKKSRPEKTTIYAQSGEIPKHDEGHKTRHETAVDNINCKYHFYARRTGERLADCKDLLILLQFVSMCKGFVLNLLTNHWLVDPCQLLYEFLMKL